MDSNPNCFVKSAIVQYTALHPDECVLHSISRHKPVGTTGLVISISTNELALAIHLETSKNVLWPGRLSARKPNFEALNDLTMQFFHNQVAACCLRYVSSRHGQQIPHLLDHWHHQPSRLPRRAVSSRAGQSTIHPQSSNSLRMLIP